MAWNGSGSYVLPAAYTPEVAGNLVDSARYNGALSDIAAGITAALAKNGENAATANLPMGGFKHTGAANAAAPGQYLVYGQPASGAFSDSNYGDLTPTASGGVNIVTATPGIMLWSRWGNIISCSGSIYAEATTGDAVTSILLTLPVAANHSASPTSENLAGAGAAFYTSSGATANSRPVRCNSDGGNPAKVKLFWRAVLARNPGIDGDHVTYTFQYKVI